MKKIKQITDVQIATQLCTLVAMALMYSAHLIEAGHILNPNWSWAIYVSLAGACFFMVVPYIFASNIESRDDYVQRMSDHHGDYQGKSYHIERIEPDTAVEIVENYDVLPLDDVLPMDVEPEEVNIPF